MRWYNTKYCDKMAMQKRTLKTKNQLEKYLKEVEKVDSTTLLNYNVQVLKLSRVTFDKLLTILQQERKIVIKPILGEMRKFNVFIVPSSN